MGFSGKYHSQESRNKIAASLLNGKPRKSRVPVGYQWGHRKVSLLRGRAFGCEFCGIQTKDKRYDWANLTGNFHNPNDYKSACRPCHKKFDNICKPITFNGRTMMMSEWAKELKITRTGLTRRLRRWPLEKALTTISKHLNYAKRKKKE